jgi:IS30 family transposase
VPKLKAHLVTDVIIRESRPIRGAVQTMKLDNSSEFLDHQTFGKALSLTSCFCDTYRPSQRDSNKNTNSLLRQYFPKGTDFAKVSRKAIRQAVNKLNSRSRKRLGYRTPAEVFRGEHSGGSDTSHAALNTWIQNSEFRIQKPSLKLAGSLGAWVIRTNCTHTML